MPWDVCSSFWTGAGSSLLLSGTAGVIPYGCDHCGTGVFPFAPRMMLFCERMDSDENCCHEEFRFPRLFPASHVWHPSPTGRIKNDEHTDRQCVGLKKYCRGRIVRVPYVCQEKFIFPSNYKAFQGTSSFHKNQLKTNSTAPSSTASSASGIR